MLTPEDLHHLCVASLGRFVLEIFPEFSIRDVSISESTLVFAGIPSAEVNEIIEHTNVLLAEAAIILGTSKLEIYDTDSNLVLAAELESEQIHISEEAMTVATAARSVEFDITPTAVIPTVVSWNRITSITGETEEELRSRLKILGIPFYWSDDSVWGVDANTASQLIIRFRFEQGQREAAMLLENSAQEQPKQQANGHNPQIKSKAEKPEFHPLKKGVTPTLEKYLCFAGKTEDRQQEILADIAQETPKGKRHLTKILNSYPEDMEKPTRGEFQVAAKKLVKRIKGSEAGVVEADSADSPCLRASEVEKVTTE
ncbi:hypothetical protein GS682_05005 [Nostoc sp. B(2019)]|nr:hypothetical protein [Nostoc sp. B(2019)]